MSAPRSPRSRPSTLPPARLAGSTTRRRGRTERRPTMASCIAAFEYWADGDDQRILFGTGDGYLICLNAQTGKPIRTFGREGRIDLTQELGRKVDRHLCGVSSPPIICRDVVVMGSKATDVPVAAEMPPGS